MAVEKPKGGLGALLGVGSTGGALSSLYTANPGSGLINKAMSNSTAVDPVALALSQILTGYPYRIEGRYFQHQRVALDGYYFIRCRFDECELVTTKASFKIEKCVFSSCELSLLGEALNAVKLFNIFSADALNREPPYLCPVYDPATRSFTVG